MFKLIASDMDGTLLDENGQVPPETYELILALHEHGVHFADAVAVLEDERALWREDVGGYEQRR